MRIKSLIIGITLTAMLAGCKDDVIYLWGNNPGTWPDDYFTFSVAEVIVDVDESTTSVELPAELVEPADEELVYDVWLARGGTTAALNKHYKLPEDMTYRFPANSTEKQVLTITLIPENITSEVVVNFGVSGTGGTPSDDLIQTISVKLKPVQE